MPPQKTSKLLKELNEEVARLEQAASTARRREEVARNIADGLEERNKTILESIDEETAIYKLTSFADVDREIQTRKQEAVALKNTKSKLQDEIVRLNKKKTKLEEEVEQTDSDKVILSGDLQNAKAELEKLNEILKDGYDQVDVSKSKLAALEDEIHSYNYAREDIKGDIEALENEASLLEERIIDQDTTFKARKEVFDKQLSDTQLKLKTALNSLQEAQNKDKAMREAWAEERQSLDKREQVVRRMEAKVSDAESRVEELKRYDRL